MELKNHLGFHLIYFFMHVLETIVKEVYLLTQVYQSLVIGKELGLHILD